MTKSKFMWCRKLTVLFCAILIFCAALPVSAHADNATITTGNMYSYFQTFGSNGVWKDIQTPSHWITSTGEVAYCLQTSKDSPYNSGYHTVDGSDYYNSYVLTGLSAILENGYPITNGGFTDEQARYATANAIRFWLAENYCDGVPQYLNLNVNGDWIRGKSGYEDLYYWSLNLVWLARNQAASSSSAGTINFSPSVIDLVENGNYFTGSSTVSSTISGGYGLYHNLPDGSSIDQAGNNITIKVPIACEQQSYTVTAYGVDNVETAKLFFWGPDAYNQQRVVTCVLDTDSLYIEGKLTVNTPKATPKAGSIQITKLGENGESLPGVSFALYDQNKSQISSGQTDANGVLTFTDLPLGNYYYAETAALPGYVLDSTMMPVSITESGQCVTVTATNVIARSNLKIIKKDAYEDIYLSGTGFRLYDSEGNVVDEQYTDHNGEVTFSDLLCGDYTYQEFKAPMGFQLDETVYPITISEGGVTITETRNNIRRPGTLVVKKQEADGNLLSGATFLLEYSLDKGSTWEAVFSRAADDKDISRGGCTSPDLADGQLTTGEDGTVTFTGLRADSRTLYRLTETKAPEGHSLIGGKLYVGTLPVESGNIYAEDSEVFDTKAYHYTLRVSVVDDPLFRLPETAGGGFTWIPFAMMFVTSPAIIMKSKRRLSE